MADQLEFGLSRNTDPVTSHMAGHSIDPGPLQMAVVLALYAAGGKSMASEQIADHLGLPHTMVWKRMSEAERHGWIWVDDEYTHTNRSGRQARRYGLTVAGIELAKAQRI